MQYVDKLVDVKDLWLALGVEEQLEELVGWMKDRMFERGISYQEMAQRLGWPWERLEKVLFLAPDLEIRDVVVVVKVLGGRVKIDA